MNLTFQYKILIALAMICLISACAKEFDEEMLDVPEVEVPVVEQVEANLSIVIQDDLANVATCTINNETYSFSPSGVLILDDILLDVSGQLIIVEAPGYVPAIRWMFPTRGESHYIYLKLEEPFARHLLEPSEGGEYEVHNNSIQVPPNCFVDNNGQVYNSQVSLGILAKSDFYYTKFNSRSNCYLKDGNESRIMSIAGWSQVQAEDENGNSLNMASPVKIVKELGIVSKHLSDFELYRFDRELLEFVFVDSLRSKEGVVEYQVDNKDLYVYGTTFKSSIVEVPISDSLGAHYRSNGVIVKVKGYNNFDSWFSNYSGKARFPVPVNQEIIVGIVNNCDNFDWVNDAKHYGGTDYSSSVQLLETWVLNDMIYNISGVVVDCDDVPLSRAHVLISNVPYSLRIVQTNDNGEFNFTVLDCVSRVNVKPVLQGVNLEHDFKSFNISNESVQSIGEVKACD